MIGARRRHTRKERDSRIRAEAFTEVADRVHSLMDDYDPNGFAESALTRVEMWCRDQAQEQLDERD